MKDEEASLGSKLLMLGICTVPLLALGLLIFMCIKIPSLGAAVVAVVVVHIPLVCFVIWGSEEDREAIANYHPPGHE